MCKITKVKDAVKSTIASNIKQARIAANMTQAEAAEKLGITPQAISNFERGINGIENSLLLRMCEIYKTNMSSIWGGNEEISPQRVGTHRGRKATSGIIQVDPRGAAAGLSGDGPCVCK